MLSQSVELEKKMNNPDCDLDRLGELRDRILLGDAFQLAETLPCECVQAIVTSPPYFGHRDYAKNSPLSKYELGRESSHQEYADRLVSIFSKLRRLLRVDGTVWLNLGDTYRDQQLLGIPWRVALAMQDDGWILRSEVIWEKPNAMPSSVKNRPTVSHEHLFLFAKSESYFYEADAVREPHKTFTAESKMKGGRNHFGKRSGTPERGKNRGNPNLHTARWDQAFHPKGRNKRTVWSIPLGKFRDVHFAVFPEQLVKTCLLACTRENDLVLDPFMGAGTTALVAKGLNRHYLGFELVSEYVKMANRRLERVSLPLFGERTTELEQSEERPIGRQTQMGMG
jgi:DNA modification methylase